MTRNTKQDVINKLYQLLKDVHDIMEKFKIKYWIDGGTSLGAIRHKGIIPWDDDVDISIMNDSKNIKILNSKKFKDYLKRYNYGIIRTNYDYKIFQLDGEPMKLNPWKEHWKLFQARHPNIKGRMAIWRAASKTYNKNKKRDVDFAFPNLDIFTMKEKKTKDGRTELIYLNTWWDKCRYEKHEVFPLKKYKFLNYHVWGPGKATKYFDKCYGNDWNDIAYKYINHVNPNVTEGAKKVRFRLKKSDRKPAKCTVKIEKRIGKLDNIKMADILNKRTMKKQKKTKRKQKTKKNRLKILGLF